MANFYLHYDETSVGVSYVLSSAYVIGTGSYSWSFWLNLEEATFTDYDVIIKGAGEVNSFLVGLEFWVNGNKFEIALYGEKDGDPIVASGSTVNSYDSLRGWHHFAIVLKRDVSPFESVMKLAIDGEFVTLNNESIFDFAGVDIDNTGVLVPGGYNGEGFIGGLDSFGVYSIALDASDISNIYNNGIGKKLTGLETGLTWGVNLDEGTGVSCADVKGGENLTIMDGGSEITWQAGGIPLAGPTTTQEPVTTSTLEPVTTQEPEPAFGGGWARRIMFPIDDEEENFIIV